jgi:hypothetical protein
MDALDTSIKELISEKNSAVQSAARDADSAAARIMGERRAREALKLKGS